MQDSVSCDTAAAATSHTHTGYPVIISPFWGMPAAPLHPPLRASWVHTSYRRSPYLVPPHQKKKSKSFIPFISNCPFTHTPRRLTHLAPQRHLDKFFFFLFFSFSFSSRTSAGKQHSQHHCCPLPSRARRPPPLTYHHTTRGMQANLPLHGPVTHATRQPRCAQPGRRRYPDYIASALTQPPVAATTSATSTPPSHQPPRCTCPHMRRRHISALPPSN